MLVGVRSSLSQSVLLNRRDCCRFWRIGLAEDDAECRQSETQTERDRGGRQEFQPVE